MKSELDKKIYLVIELEIVFLGMNTILDYKLFVLL